MNVVLQYKPKVRQLNGYSAFIDFATAREAIRAISELDARQLRGDLVGLGKSIKARNHIELSIEGETKKERRKRLASMSESKRERTNQRYFLRERVTSISELQQEDERYLLCDGRVASRREPKQEEKDNSCFLRISDLPFEATEHDVRGFLGEIETYYAPHPDNL